MRHCFRNWLHLTRKFMVELNSENIEDKEKHKVDREQEDFEKVKMSKN